MYVYFKVNIWKVCVECIMKLYDIVFCLLLNLMLNVNNGYFIS